MEKSDMSGTHAKSRLHEDTIRLTRHEHNFDSVSHDNEKRTLRVIILTGITMIIEIVTGMLTGSMALLADGWHMGTHAFALGITYSAYLMARRFAGSQKFGFGTGKFGILSAYTSALFLGATALYMIVESVTRIIAPVAIAFNEAIVVALAGFAVNVLSIWILHADHTHHSDHDHHEHGHHLQDHNLRAAYLHVVADALTSILAVVALITGKFLGWSILDPVMGIIGGLLIARWAWGLLRSSALILLDGNEDCSVNTAIIETIESDRDSVVGDLHVWPLTSGALAAAITVVTRKNRSPLEYSMRLSHLGKLKHTTIEVHLCDEQSS
jgi:cation diffusion facilitator family transporter